MVIFDNFCIGVGGLFGYYVSEICCYMGLGCGLGIFDCVVGLIWCVVFSF